jgi:hypothetical protein
VPLFSGLVRKQVGPQTFFDEKLTLLGTRRTAGPRCALRLGAWI